MTLICPSCNTKTSHSDAACPSCGYGYQLLDDYHKARHNNDLTATSVTDTTRTLSASALKKIRHYTKSFRATFPDLFFAVYLESNKEKATTKGLWLLNNISFSDDHQQLPSQQSFLLYIDPEEGSVAISYGLSLSPYISTEDANNFLRPSTSYFAEGLYPQAIKLIIEQATQFLISTCPKR